MTEARDIQSHVLDATRDSRRAFRVGGAEVVIFGHGTGSSSDSSLTQSRLAMSASRLNRL